MYISVSLKGAKSEDESTVTNLTDCTYSTLNVCPLAELMQLATHTLINTNAPLLDRLLKLVTIEATPMFDKYTLLDISYCNDNARQLARSIS
jgi:hypothetical protein